MKRVIIMYENGRQVNRYEAKMIHKRKQKRLYRRYFWGRGLKGNSWEDYVAHADEDDNSKLRSMFKDEYAHADYEDICSLHHSQYKKYFDYWWTIV